MNGWGKLTLRCECLRKCKQSQWVGIAKRKQPNHTFLSVFKLVKNGKATDSKR
ncbi:hypothetical protein D11S_2259 [Aggregatibacter phage S1249]|uniref:hypothetical protein n=1 Tax=Aggregatibacter phage S1249 TaxID=683735 RepID=UPI0001BA1511|nr:hypothetical protein D11S_2259 [Aggregatibacter phage S1249]ACX80332.1 hypothetical protein D11S_2259 [Aggregatibacter phage S1249]